jgi:hypothetical protein
VRGSLKERVLPLTKLGPVTTTHHLLAPRRLRKVFPERVTLKHFAKCVFSAQKGLRKPKKDGSKRCSFWGLLKIAYKEGDLAVPERIFFRNLLHFA